MKNPILATLLLTASLPAATVVSDTFTGTAGATLTGTAPDVGPASTNWVGNSGFRFVTGGGVTNTNATSVNGNAVMASVNLGVNYMANNVGIHTVSMNVSTTATDTDVIGIGFGPLQGTSTNSSYASATHFGTPWMFLRANGEGQVRSGANTLSAANTNFGTSTGSRLLTLVLDNSGSIWTLNASVGSTAFDLNGALPGTTYSYTNNPTTINNVGITFTETDSLGNVSNFVYDFVAVPEPSAALLGALGALSLLRRRR